MDIAADTEHPNFAHLYNPNCPNRPTCTDEELCKIAKEDAWHDHGDIKGLNPFASASKHLNLNNSCDDPLKNEDTFMFDRVLNQNDKRTILAKPISNISEIPENPDIFTQVVEGEYANMITKVNSNLYHPEHIQGRYTVYNISSIDRDEAPGGETVVEQPSLIQTLLFDHLKITDDVYFIRDVAYGNFADDIYNWDQTDRYGGQIATFLITSQGQYDPGPTVTCLTDAGVRIGMGHYQGTSAKLCKRTTNRNVRFGMYDIDVESERVTNYPTYPILTGDRITRNRAEYPPQAMMSTKFESYMVSEIDYNGLENTKSTNAPLSYQNVDTILSSSNTTLFILDPTDEIGQNSITGKIGKSFGYGGTKNVFTIDKNTSNKATTLDSVIRKISTKISGKGITNIPNLPFDSTAYDYLYTSEEICKILSKKFGDHAQAIKTIDPVISYIEFDCIYDNTMLSRTPEFETSRKKSSGVHVFVTYDRVAATSAIEYGAPIVLFNNHDGFLIYISNNLIRKYESNKNVFDSKLAEYKTNYDIYSKLNSETEITSVSENVEKLKDTKVDIINRQINLIMDHLIETDITDDQKYTDFLKVYYVLSPVLTILSNFYNLYKNIENNIKHTRSSLRGIIPDSDPNKYEEQNVDDSVYKADSVYKDRLSTLIGLYDGNNTIYKEVINLSKYENKLNSIYTLLIEKVLSIVQKLGVCHSKKPKKNGVRQFISELQNIEYDTFVVWVDNHFYEIFIGCLTYINDLIDQDTLTELSKINPTSTLSLDRVSRLFTGCLSNSSGAIPSLGIPIIKIIHKQLNIRDKQLNTHEKARFDTKIYHYLVGIGTKTKRGKIDIYNSMLDNYYKETEFEGAQPPQPPRLVGGRKTSGRNRTYKKAGGGNSISKKPNGEQTHNQPHNQPHNQTQKHLKLIKGGGLFNKILLNRDRIVIATLLYEYRTLLHNDEKLYNWLTRNYKDLISILDKFCETVKVKELHTTKFLPENLLLIEPFAFEYKTNYLYEELTLRGKFYYRFAQLFINIIQELIVDKGIDTGKKIDRDERIKNVPKIEIAIKNMISELQRIKLTYKDGNTRYNNLIDTLFVLCVNIKNSKYVGFITIITKIFNFITEFIGEPIWFDAAKYEYDDFYDIVNKLLPPNIVNDMKKFQKEQNIQPIQINHIIGTKLSTLSINHDKKENKNITSLLEPADFTDFYPADLVTDIQVSMDITIGDFTQVLSLGASDEGRELLLVDHYFSIYLTDENISKHIINSDLYKNIGKSIRYIQDHFGNIFFNKYFPSINTVLKSTVPIPLIASKHVKRQNILPTPPPKKGHAQLDYLSKIKTMAVNTIKNLQFINKNTQQFFIKQISNANLEKDVRKILYQAHMVHKIDKLQFIDHDDKQGLINGIMYASTREEMDKIIEDANIINNEKSTSIKNNVKEDIRRLQFIDDKSRETELYQEITRRQTEKKNIIDSMQQEAIKEVNSMQYILGERDGFIEKIRNAKTFTAIQEIVTSAKDVNELNTAKHAAIQTINDTLLNSDHFIDRVHRAETINDVTQIISEVIEQNNAMDLNLGVDKHAKKNLKPRLKEYIKFLQERAKKMIAKSRKNRYQTTEEKRMTPQEKQRITKAIRMEAEAIRMAAEAKQRGHNDLYGVLNEEEKEFLRLAGGTNRKQNKTYKIHNKKLHRSRKTRKITKRPKYIKNYVTRSRR